MKRIGLVLLVLSLGACYGDGQAVATMPADGHDYSVVKLFEVDGCTVYRFHDGYSRYFSDCGTVSTCRPQGKTVHCD